MIPKIKIIMSEGCLRSVLSSHEIDVVLYDYDECFERDWALDGSIGKKADQEIEEYSEMYKDYDYKNRIYEIGNELEQEKE